ncbi:MFS transporter [Streptomyces xanthochromogenes]|uniref:MFS transporter n=1 Tax=Streptomyces xanthochromogenes TaxID=67384 RepID=UPI0034250AC2
MPLAVLALAISGFAIGVAEFVIAGLLPDIGSALSVSTPTAGLLVSGYAIGVVVGAPTLAFAARRMERRRLLIQLMALFLAGTVLSAIAPTYAVLMAGRIVSALAHGAFFGVAMVVAAGLVAEDKRGRAISMIGAGLTLSTVLGVPLGTLVGQHLGWRWAFWLVALCAAAGLAGIAALVPVSRPDTAADLRSEISVLRRPAVVLTLLTTVFGFGGVMTSYTYIADTMTRVTGFSAGAVTMITMIFGLGMFAGNLVGGRLTDRRPTLALWGSLALLVAVLAVFTLTVHSKPAACVTVFFFGAAAFATIPPLQTRIMRQADGAPTLASASNIAAFNLANTAGPLLGGWVISAGFGYAALNGAAALVSAVGLVLALVTVAAGRAPARSRVTNAAPAVAPDNEPLSAQS